MEGETITRMSVYLTGLISLYCLRDFSTDTRIYLVATNRILRKVSRKTCLLF